MRQVFLLLTALVLAAAPSVEAAPATGGRLAAIPRSPFKDCADGCPEMVVIPQGVARRGRPCQTYGDPPPRCIPPEEITIDHPFAVGRFDVTVGEYAAFVSATGLPRPTGCSTDRDPPGPGYMDEAGSWRDPGFEQSDRHPVVCVNLEDARAYAAWLSKKTGRSYRLPTEPEWAFAARGGAVTDTTYWHAESAGGQDACRWANIGDDAYFKAFPMYRPGRGSACEDGVVHTSAVGRYPPNGYGLYDMAGNVGQLTLSPGGGILVSGGSWMSQPTDLWIDYSAGWFGERRASWIGFRVVADL